MMVILLEFCLRRSVESIVTQVGTKVAQILRPGANVKGSLVNQLSMDLTIVLFIAAIAATVGFLLS